MRRNRFPVRSVLVVTALAATVAVIAAWGPLQGKGRAALDSDTAVVLLSDADSELVTVDLLARRVGSRHPLRSLSLSIAADQKTRSVVIAQCGGVGSDADDVCGVLSSNALAVEYVDLGIPNPLQVVASNGQAVLFHGFEQEEGLVVSSVGIADRSLRPMRHVPSASGYLVGAPTGAYDFVNGGESIPYSRMMHLPESGSPSDVATITAAITNAAVADETIYATGIRSYSNPEQDGFLFRLSPDGKIEREARLLDIQAPLTDIECLGDTIALAENDHADPEESSARVLFFDRETFEPRGVVRFAQAPIAITTWGEHLLVVDGSKGELHVFEPGETTASWSVDLGGHVDIATDIVAFN